MTKETLEKKQIGIYVVALALGAALGLWRPATAPVLERVISPVLAVLLYGMFAQIPLLRLREAFSNKAFLGALLTVNFIIVPVVVWLLTRLLPQQAPLLLGVYLVLLCPCIDYVIVFTHLGRGNALLILAAAPLLLLVQMLLLPVYLWLFMGTQAAELMSAGPFVEAFLMLIVLPLGLALLTEFWAAKNQTGKTLRDGTGWLPVPFMALTLLLVVASQIGKIQEFLPLVSRAIPVYVAFMVLMPFLSRMTARVFRLDVEASRAVVFSSGIRNSLVVLPLVLSLPSAWAMTPAVIVTQTLVELAGCLLYIYLVPSFLLTEK